MPSNSSAGAISAIVAAQKKSLRRSGGSLEKFGLCFQENHHPGKQNKRFDKGQPQEKRELNSRTRSRIPSERFRHRTCDAPLPDPGQSRGNTNADGSANRNRPTTRSKRRIASGLGEQRRSYRENEHQ